MRRGLRAAASLLAVLLSTAAADPLALTNFTTATAVTSAVVSVAVQARSHIHFGAHSIMSFETAIERRHLFSLALLDMERAVSRGAPCQRRHKLTISAPSAPECRL